MTTTRALWRLLALATVAACNGGYTTEEATSLCEAERQRLAACFDDAVMQNCIACHEECGRDCSLVSGPTCSYSCD